MALTFWYDFSSSYSYLAAMRMADAASAAGVEVTWRPFLLGPIFMEAGYGGSPNLMLPQKADYMWADIARRAAHRGLPFVKPKVFPQKSVLAGRAALAVADEDRPALTRAVFSQTYAHGNDIAQPETVHTAATEAGLNADTILARTGEGDIKQALFAAVDEAKAAGLFGAPAFVTSDGTLFWGDDRMEDALSWEATGRLA